MSENIRDTLLNALFWRLATLALRLPSPQLGLTAVFGMRTGVTRAINHQNKIFKNNAPLAIEERHERPKPDTAKLSPVGQERRKINTALLTIPEELFCRLISTPRLNALRRFHLVPINVVISHESITIPYLGVGFPLRCFQRLSNPDIATGRCTWRYSPQTSGQFIPVLSY